jgi:hypothetical protein
MFTNSGLAGRQVPKNPMTTGLYSPPRRPAPAHFPFVVFLVVGRFETGFFAFAADFVFDFEAVFELVFGAAAFAFVGVRRPSKAFVRRSRTLESREALVRLSKTTATKCRDPRRAEAATENPAARMYPVFKPSQPSNLPTKG